METKTHPIEKLLLLESNNNSQDGHILKDNRLKKLSSFYLYNLRIYRKLKAALSKSIELFPDNVIR